MGTVIKIVFISAAVISIAGILSAFIPTTFSSSINSSFVYFLSSISVLNFLFNVATLYTCLQIIGNFLYAVAIFYTLKWTIHIFS